PYFIPPVKVGEQVLVMYDEPDVASNIGFWICRIPELNEVDDVNYTHGDRRYSLNVDTDTIDRIEQLSGDSPTIRPNFSNGPESGDAPSLGASPDEYDKVVASSRAGSKFAYEAVPRFTSHPGDLTV